MYSQLLLVLFCIFLNTWNISSPFVGFTPFCNPPDRAELHPYSRYAQTIQLGYLETVVPNMASHHRRMQSNCYTFERIEILFLEDWWNNCFSYLLKLWKMPHSLWFVHWRGRKITFSPKKQSFYIIARLEMLSFYECSILGKTFLVFFALLQSSSTLLYC